MSGRKPRRLKLNKTSVANLGGIAGGTFTPTVTIVEATVEVGSVVTRNTGRLVKSAIRSAKATEHTPDLSNPSGKGSNSCGFTGGCPNGLTNSK